MGQGAPDDSGSILEADSHSVDKSYRVTLSCQFAFSSILGRHLHPLVLFPHFQSTGNPLLPVTGSKTCPSSILTKLQSEPHPPRDSENSP